MLPPELPPPPTQALRVVQAAYLALAQRMQDNHAHHALQPDQAVSQRALANQLGYDPSNLTGLIDNLEARGAVRRRPDDRDRRMKSCC